jgi:TRAP transporter TAXI family solute receptor
MLPRLSRRTFLAALAAPLAGVSLTGCLGRDWASFSDTRLVLATGNPGGVFARYGDALATVLGRRLDGVTTRTRITDASVENLRLVGSGEADLGLSLGDAASDAARGTGTFAEPLDVVALTRTYDSFVHLVVRAESPISDVQDLRSRRVGLGTPDSGTRVVAERILRQSGVPLSDVEAASQRLQADADALVAGRLDAFFFVSGLPNEAVLEVSRRIPVRLVSLRDQVDAMVGSYGPEYVDGPVPASTYGLAEAADTVSIKNYVVIGSRMPDDLAYAVTRVMFEAQADIDALAPGVRQPNPSAGIFTSPLDLHPGAVRYFREQRG